MYQNKVFFANDADKEKIYALKTWERSERGTFINCLYD